MPSLIQYFLHRHIFPFKHSFSLIVFVQVDKYLMQMWSASHNNQAWTLWPMRRKISNSQWRKKIGNGYSSSSCHLLNFVAYTICYVPLFLIFYQRLNNVTNDCATTDNTFTISIKVWAYIKIHHHHTYTQTHIELLSGNFPSQTDLDWNPALSANQMWEIGYHQFLQVLVSFSIKWRKYPLS